MKVATTNLALHYPRQAAGIKTHALNNVITKCVKKCQACDVSGKFSKKNQKKYLLT